MPKIALFSTVILKDKAMAHMHDMHGPMIVKEIRKPEEAEFYGSYEFMCRSLANGKILDFQESELLVVG